MQVLKDAVVINLSPSQRKVFRDAKYAACFAGVGDAGSSRPRIPVGEISGLVERLRRLQMDIVADPEYQNRDPVKVIERIILIIEDAAAAQKRAFPVA
jgi:hypothetical protein